MSQLSEKESEARPLSCGQCDATFKRKEHLARHIQRHSGSKPFQCKLCTRSFSRRDTLVRHLGTHGVDASDPGLLPPRISKRSLQACARCAQAKQTCRGSPPCERCVRKGLVCEQSPRRDRRRSQVSTTQDVSGSDHRVMSLADEDDDESMSTTAETEFVSEESPPTSTNVTADPSVGMYATHSGHMDVSTDAPNNDPTTNHLQWNMPLGSYTPHGYEGDFIWGANSLSGVSSPAWWMTRDHLLPGGDVMMSQSDVPTQGLNILADLAPFPNDHFTVPDSIMTSTGVHATETQYNLKDGALISDPLFLHFQAPHSDDHYIALTERFGHLNIRFITQYAEIVNFHSCQSTVPTTFLDEEVFHGFLELYFEHFDHQFPFVHPSMLNANSTPWLLLLAMAAVGAQYSAMSVAASYASALRDLLHRAIKFYLPVWPDHDRTTIAQAALLLDICMFFTDGQRAHISRQYDRNILVTLFISIKREPHRTNTSDALSDAQPAAAWQQWLATESRIRLLYCIYRLQCLDFILLDQRPAINLADVMVKLPSDDSLWSCRSASEWSSQMRKHPLSWAPGHESTTDNPTQTNSANFSQNIHVLSMYVEERLLVDKLRSSPVHQIQLGIGHHRQHSDLGSQQKVPALALASVATSIEKEFDMSLFLDLSTAQERNLQDPLPPIILLLRKVPLRNLYTFSGWRAGPAEVETAGASLRSWMLENPASARRCLCYAVQIFSMLRVKAHLACYDGLFLLIGGLYIWTYDLLMPGSGGTIQQQSQPETPTSGVLRLDRSLDDTVVESWVADGDEVRLHITGVGILNGLDSAQRVLIGVRNALTTQVAWAGHCRAIAAQMSQLIEGRMPEMPA